MHCRSACQPSLQAECKRPKRIGSGRTRSVYSKSYILGNDRYFNPDDGEPNDNWHYDTNWPDEGLDAYEDQNQEQDDEDLGSGSSTEPESDDEEEHRRWKERAQKREMCCRLAELTDEEDPQEGHYQEEEHRYQEEHRKEEERCREKYHWEEKRRQEEKCCREEEH